MYKHIKPYFNAVCKKKSLDIEQLKQKDGREKGVFIILGLMDFLKSC